MTKLLTGLFLGIACGLVGAWLWSIRQQESDEANHRIPHNEALKDLNWFALVDGFPELIHKAPGLADALSVPEQVSVYRVVKGSGDVQVGQYSLGQSHPASEDHAYNYSKVLCSPTSVTNLSACAFTPGFAIRFKRNKSHFFALVCYSCGDILILDPYGEQVGGFGMTKEAEATLARMFRETFPDDPEVQGLKF